MTKEEILKEFSDCPRLDTLSKMLDELLKGHETVTEFADRCKECGKLKQDKELEQNIASSFYFGMALGFGSKYDEKDEILKSIREMIDEKNKKYIDAIDIARMCERSTKSLEDYIIKSSLTESKELCEDKESCDNCKHNTESWDSDACDGCCGANSKWSGEIYPGEFEAMEQQGRFDALIPEQKMMTRQEAIEELSILLNKYQDGNFGDALDMAIEALEQEPFMNKPCVANQVCHEDKVKMLDKIRAEIIAKDKNVKAIRSDGCCFFTADEILNILNKYKEESEVSDADSD